MVHTSDFKQRQPWLDIAKGIGITAVVLGHSGSSIAYYLYWFHMPLFFIISGYLFKPHEDWATLSNWLYKRTCQLLIPYLSFLIIIVTVEFYLGNRCFDAYKVASSFSLNFFPGGKFIGGFYTTFWFITCLYVTQLIFALLHKSIKSHGWCLIIIAAAYLLAHYESAIADTHPLKIPWDIDVALLTLSYYAFGFYAKKMIKHVHAAVSTLSVAFSIGLLICGLFGLFSYSINIKYGTCSHLLMDLVIPIVMSVALLSISQKCSHLTGNVFAILGKYSLPVMYLHLPVNIILHNYLNYNYGYLSFALIGLVIPTLAGLIFDRFQLTKILLLGCSDIPFIPERILSWRTIVIYNTS
ncbi:MAG: acyltransferase family protein [Desulfotomaculaceae bacterium]